VLELPFRAKALVIGSVVRASLIWALPVVAAVSSPWILAGFVSGTWSWRPLVAALIVPTLLVAAVCLAFPHERYGDMVVRRIRNAGGTPSNRTVNLADQLSIATGSYSHRVVVVPSPVPNVAAIPGKEATWVVVTTGAESQVARDDLEALMATQIVVASDPWVRVASTAQLVSAPRFALLFGCGFLNPLLIPFAFVAFFGHRRGDTVRDMVADSAALRATRHPEPLARALYGLRPAAPVANKLKVGLPGFMVDQYWVLSKRITVTTTVSGMGQQRQWTTGDEIAAEMAMRSDRILRGSRGELDALFDLKSWKKAVRGLGTGSVSPAGLPIALTPSEHLITQGIRTALSSPPPTAPAGPR
jgi:Zn-dependent protease with chaperone function